MATRQAAKSKEASQESWQNSTRGTVALKRLDHRGELTRDELVSGGKTFHITPEERKINMEMAAGPELDVFRNGTLVPVRLIEGTEDARELAANPNLMSETDMRALVKTKEIAARLGQITNASALERMLRIAEEEDAAVSIVRAIQGRLRAVTSPVQDSREISPSGAPISEKRSRDGSEKRPRGVTPR